jgi:hypothetical protein
MARIIIISDEDEGRKHELSSREVDVVLHAMQIAAERFDEDAKEFGKVIVAMDSRRSEPEAPKKSEDGSTMIVVPIITRPGAVQMKEQFERQAAETRDVRSRIEGIDYEDEES